MSPPSSQVPSDDTISTNVASLTSNDPRDYMIRATQGHSMKKITSEATLEAFTPSHPAFPITGYVVHGTYSAAWGKIESSGGLKPMGRKHIHFATNELPPLPPPGDVAHTRPIRNLQQQQKDDDAPEDADKVISGMRRDATILVWVDVKGSIDRGGVKWWRSANGVILTEGEEGKDMLGLEWVAWVDRRGTDQVLYGTKPGLDVVAKLGQTSRSTTNQQPAKVEIVTIDGQGEQKPGPAKKTDEVSEKTSDKENLPDNWDD